MPEPSASALLRDAHESARRAAEILRLPFQRTVKRGQTGSFVGTGVGSSIDFQDHRAYYPGDDPRYIDWAAYARTGSYTMKLYRQEVLPRLDLILDCSSSFSLAPAKERRVLELLYFLAESAASAHASLRVFALNGEESAENLPESLWSYRLDLPRGKGEPCKLPTLSGLALRADALRVFVSDLLFPGSPAQLLSMLKTDRSQAMIFAPFEAGEAEPPWSGNTTFVDCESGFERRQLVDDTVLERYRATYRRHFELWREECHRHGVVMARVKSEGDLVQSLCEEGLANGALDI